MKSRVIRILLVTALTLPMLVSMSGCAFGDRHIALKYAAVGEVGSPKNQKVGITQFQDLRETKEVGEVRNAYGFKTAKVVADNQHVGAWVANAMSEELAQQGFEVEKFSDVIPPNYEIQIGGVVTEAYTKMYFNATARITINVNITKSGVSVLSKEYSGKKAVAAMFVSPGEYESAMQGALQDLMKQCLPEILEALS